LEQKKELQAIEISQVHSVISKGSLVKSNKGLIFVGPGLGKLTVENETLIAVSLSSPLGQKLIGKKKGGEVDLNGTKYFIEEII